MNYAFEIQQIQQIMKAFTCLTYIISIVLLPFYVLDDKTVWNNYNPQVISGKKNNIFKYMDNAMWFQIIAWSG